MPFSNLPSACSVAPNFDNILCYITCTHIFYTVTLAPHLENESTLYCLLCVSQQELIGLEKDANVYKMIGPVLVKQDVEEAKQNVQKRIDYITGEMYVA